MSRRHRTRDAATEAEVPRHADRVTAHRQERRAVTQELHVAMVDDPELADTALTEMRGAGVHHGPKGPRVGSKRLRAWKTREWKRRTNARRQRLANEARLLSAD